MHQSRAIRRIKRNSSAQKNIMNVRLSFGPIYVPQPFESRLISCNLDLINHKTLNADYDYKVFAFLSNQDLGVDMTAKDYAEYTKTKSVERQQTNPGRIVPVVTTSDAVVTTPAQVVTTESSVVTTQSSVVTTQSSVITSAPAETKHVRDMSNEELNKIFNTEKMIEELEQKIIRVSLWFFNYLTNSIIEPCFKIYLFNRNKVLKSMNV